MPVTSDYLMDNDFDRTGKPAPGLHLFISANIVNIRALPAPARSESHR
jgi:hypothetical protein